MKKMAIILFSVLIIFSCKKNERVIYMEKDGVYFTNYLDTATYSFTMTTENEYDFEIEVRVVGRASNVDRRFKLKLGENSTAEAGKHFRELEEYYIFPKGEVVTTIPIHLYCTEDLKEIAVVLDLQIDESEDFTVGFYGQTTTILAVTDRLVKPLYWDNVLSLYYSDYSRVKHQIATELMGHDFPLVWRNNANEAKYYMLAGREASIYFIHNEVFDENGKLIETWDPF